MNPADPNVTQAPPEPAASSEAAWDAGLAAAFSAGETASHHLSTDPEAGTILAGKYRLSERIGEGGMGSVWVAHQSEPVKRKVAVKLIKAGMDSKSVLARFEAERQALAVMDHPNIAKVLDGGLHESRPFFVMELVKGVPITQYCDANKLTPQQRLELFVPVCQAIQHAHQKGIIHRDIKPSNVIIALYDDKPVPKVIDFGIAKATGGTLTEHTIETQFGGVVGTPQYMSPEQASLNNLDIDTRSDVYSLGVLLYELLAGSPPFAKVELEKRGLLEMLRVVREEEPPRPSTKLSTADALPSLSANRGTEPKKLTGLLRNELDWIVMKALEKDRSRRYESANGFAADINLYLAGEAVHAHPPSVGYRLRKFVRRNKGQVIAASLVLLVLLAGMAGTTWGLIEARKQEQEAKRQEKLARDETDAKEIARLDEAQRVTERDAALKREGERADERDKANYELKHRLGISSMLLAAAAYDNHDVKLAAERLAQVPEEQRGWEWRYLKQQTRGGLFTLYGHRGPVTCVAFSPDGTRIVSGGGHQLQPGEVKVWDAQTGSAVVDLKGLPTLYGINTPVKNVAISPDGTRIITRGETSTAIVCDARTGTVLFELKGHTTQVQSMAFSPDGARIVTGGSGQPRSIGGGRIEGKQGPGEVKVWDARTGTVLLELKGHTGSVDSVSFSPDGTRIATGGGDFGAPDETKVWDATTGKALLELNATSALGNTVSFSPDGTRIVVGNDTMAKVVDARTGTTLLELKGRTRRETGGMSFAFGAVKASFSPDGTRIVTAGGENGEATVWDAKTGTSLLELTGHTNGVMSVAFSPDGTRIVTGSADGTVKVWDARTGSGRLELAGHRFELHGAAFSPDGTRIVTGCGEFGKPGTATVWHARTGTALVELKGFKGMVNSVSFSGDGTRVVTGGGVKGAGEATVWDAQTGMPLLELKGLKGIVNSVAFSPDGTQAVTGAMESFEDGGSELKVWDARTGKILHDLTEPTTRVMRLGAKGWSVAFSPDGTRIVAGGGRYSKGVGDRAIVLDARSGKVLLELSTNKRAVLSVSFSPDGLRIVTGDADATATVWDAVSGALLLELKGHQGGVMCAAFSSDATRIVTGGVDRTVKVWDLRTGIASVELKGHASAVTCVSFNRDGTRILSAGGERGRPGEALVWDARPVTDSPDLKGLTEHLTAVSFSPDGTRLVTIDAKTGKVWDVPTGTLQFELKGSTGLVKSVAFSLDGTRIVTVNHGKSSKVWDAKTGEELKNEPIPKSIPDERTTPDGRLFAHVQGNRVQFVSLRLDPEEIEYRRIQIQPNFGRYREGYLAARAAKDVFAAKFYLKLVPPADQAALVAKADVDALVPLAAQAEAHLRARKPELAVPLFIEIMNVEKAALGPDDSSTLESMTRLGVIYWQLRQFDKSVPLFEELLKSRVAKHGRDHLESLRALASLGVNYRDAGKSKVAIPLLEEAQRAANKYPELAYVTGELLEAYARVGENTKGANLLQEIVNVKKADLGPEHLETLGAMTQLGVVYWQMRQLDKSVPIFEELLKSRVAKHGRDHLESFRAMANLGVNYRDAGKLKEAIPLLEEAQRATNNYPELAHVTRKLLEAYAMVGEIAKCANLLQEIVNDKKAKLGPQHLETLEAMSQLAVVCWQLRQLDKSVPLFEEVLKGREAKLGRDDAQTLTVVANLGVNYRDAGKLKDAIALLEEVQRATTKHPELRWVTSHLIDAYTRAEEHDKATNLMQENLAEARKALPKDSPELANILAQSGLILLDQKKWTVAEPLIRECLAIREKSMPDAWQTFNSKAQLGAALLGQKKYADAEPLLLAGYEGLKAREKTIPPPGIIRIPDALDRLVELYTATNKPDEVKKWQSVRTKYPAPKQPEKK